MENWIHQINRVNHRLVFESLNSHPYGDVFQALLDLEVQTLGSGLGTQA